MSLESFVLICPKCGNLMDLIDDDVDEPSWECPDCRMTAYGEDGDVRFSDFSGDEGYTYDEVYSYLD